jgi:hypothetical protein
MTFKINKKVIFSIFLSVGILTPVCAYWYESFYLPNEIELDKRSSAFSTLHVNFVVLQHHFYKEKYHFSDRLDTLEQDWNSLEQKYRGDKLGTLYKHTLLTDKVDNKYAIFLSLSSTPKEEPTLFTIIRKVKHVHNSESFEILRCKQKVKPESTSLLIQKKAIKIAADINPMICPESFTGIHSFIQGEDW